MTPRRLGVKDFAIINPNEKGGPNRPPFPSRFFRSPAPNGAGAYSIPSIRGNHSETAGM